MDMRARCEVCAGGPIDREMMDHFRLDFLLTDKELEGA